MLPTPKNRERTTNTSIVEPTAELPAEQRENWHWEKQYGREVDKDDVIWSIYAQAATQHDQEVIEALIRGLDVLLTFSALFSAVVTSFILQTESGLNLWDIPSQNGKILIALYTYVIMSQNPELLNPELAQYNDENPYFLKVSVVLWYCSLYISLLVAGGAVCGRQWLLEYSRSNALDRVPYHRAMRHQGLLASLKRWLIPEFGDLLGCLVLIDVILFVAGCNFHLSFWRTGDYILQDITTGTLALASTFLGFTIIVGVLVPHSAYKSPISNLVKSFPLKIFRKAITHFWYIVVIGIIGAACISAVCVVWVETVDLDLWLVFLWLLPMTLGIVYGLIVGLRRGRRSHYVPLMGLAIGVLATVSLISVLAPTYFVYGNWDAIAVVFSFAVPIAFAIVVVVLSRRFSTAKTRWKFPAVPLIVSTVGIMVALFISWRFTYRLQYTQYPDALEFEESWPQYNWLVPTCTAIVWASMILLSSTTLLQEADVEEDTLEAEALGWLITQIGDFGKLHVALACIPSIGKTPLRRQKILEHARSSITSLIHSLAVSPQQRGLLTRSSGDTEGCHGCYGAMDHEARLKFYITCLAELSQVMPLEVESSLQVWWIRCLRRLRRSWLYVNWHRIIIRPSRSSYESELRFDHDWYPWFKLPSDMLQDDLQILTTHPNYYTRAISRAALYQLYPRILSPTDVSSWPVLRSTAKPESDFLGRLQMLAELRMVTMRAIDMYRQNRTADASVLRYLFRYCDNALQMWIREDSPQDENFFETAMLLGYLILENNSDIPGVTNSGDSVPMKVARCITALKRWIDHHQASTEGKQDMDSKLHESFTNSIVGATLKYMQLVAKTIESGSHSISKDELVEVDEDSIGIGMRCLERSLRELTTQEWPTKSLHDQLISALEVFPLINNDPAIRVLPHGSKLDMRPLMKQLKSRATSSSATAEDKAAAIRAACKLLNEVSSSSKAWELDSDESPSLPEILRSFVEHKAIESRLFVLSAVIDTSILCPTTARSHEPATSGHVGELPSTSQETRIDTVPYHHDLNMLYSKILEELHDPISETPTQLNKDLIEKTITFISALVDSVPNISLLSTSLEKQYMSPVASIASHSDESLISTATRKKAVSILGHLWDSLYDKTSENGSQGDMLTYQPYLKEVAKAITSLVDCHGSVEWKCINVWVKLLDKVSQNPLQVEMLHQSGLVEALIDAVPWVDFGEPDEARRRTIFDQLTRLNNDLKEEQSPLKEEQSPVKEETSSLKFAKS